MATLSVNLGRISKNLQRITESCRELSLNVVGVVKPCQEFPPIVEVFDKSDVSYLGMSKVSVVKRLKGQIRTPVMLTGMPRPDQADDVVSCCALSLNSELDTIKKLSSSAQKLGCKHGIILMVDVGDLREGVMPEDVLDTARSILEIRNSGVVLAGLGANYACANGVLPSKDNLELLNTLAEDVENCLGHRLDIISAGGSAILEWIKTEILPEKINQIRVGQSILLGTIPGSNTKHPLLNEDTMHFESTIIEIKSKPSAPVGPRGGNAFGLREEVADLGTRRRAILDFGVVDTDPRALVVTEPGMAIVVSNSDYTVVDVTDCDRPFYVGDKVRFGLRYRSMLQSFLSPNVPKSILTSEFA